MANPEYSIQVPEPMKEFLQQKGKYAPKATTSPISYSGILGNNPDELPAELTMDPVMVEHAECYEFSNHDDAARKEAEASAVAALRFLFGPGRYSHVRRGYMIDTSSQPIRVRFRVDGMKTRKEAYAKKPDTDRLLGRFL